MQIQNNHSLKSLNTLNVGATAARYICVTDETALLQSLEFSAQEKLSPVILGGGSNMIFAQDSLPLVIHMCNRGIEILDESDDSYHLKVAAGENWHQLVMTCLDKHYYGLENLSLIPGTVGAAPIQNIGAYGIEFEQLFHRLDAVEIATGEKRQFTHQECQFAYRDSIFKQSLRDTYVITSVELILRKQPLLNTSYASLDNEIKSRALTNLTPKTISDLVCEIRTARLPDPSTLANVGSFFTHPIISRTEFENLCSEFPNMPFYEHGNDLIKIPSGYLIDMCGLKGTRDGDVGTYAHNSLVIVNYADANGKKILAFATHITSEVKNKFGIELTIEPRIYP